MKQLIIGIAGVAGAGKNTLADLLEKELKHFDLTSKQYALADSLKCDLREFCTEKLGISPTSCTREEKEIIRPLIVGYAEVTRRLSKGKVYSSQLEEKIRNDLSNVIIVTDIRFDEYDEDEVYWLREKMGGLLIHVSRFDMSKSSIRKFYPPANEVEARNDDKLKEKADYVFAWPSVEERGLGFLNRHAVKIVQWLIDTRKINHEG